MSPGGVQLLPHPGRQDVSVPEALREPLRGEGKEEKWRGLPHIKGEEREGGNKGEEGKRE